MNKAIINDVPIGYAKAAVKKITEDAYTMYKGIRPKRHGIGPGPGDEAAEDGGAGSGNWSHEGLPGYHGGSAPNYRTPPKSEGIRKGEIVTYREGEKMVRAQVVRAHKEGESVVVTLQTEAGKITEVPIERIEDIESREVGYGSFNPSKSLKLGKDSDEELNKKLGDRQRELNKKGIQGFKDLEINKTLGQKAREGRKDGSNNSSE